MNASQRVTRRRIEAALDTLGDLLSEDAARLPDGRDRDEVSHVRFLLEQILEARP